MSYIVLFGMLYIIPFRVYNYKVALIYTPKGLFLLKVVDNIPEKVYNIIVQLYLCAKEISK